jgi:AraC-like DNA-binding protein
MYIRYHWIMHSDATICQLTFPIGCMQLIFHKGTPLYVSTSGCLQSPATVSGQTNYPSYLKSSGNLKMIVTVFEPYAAGCLLKLPCDLLYNREVAAEDLGDRSLNELSRRIREAENDDICINLIERWLLQRISDSPVVLNTNRVHHAIREMNRNPFVSLPKLAEETNLSRKQFNRIFSTMLGMNPKEFYRIVRFQRALRIMQNKTDTVDHFSDIAYACGFPDQSYMIKEFKTFTGLTPLHLTKEGPPYSDYFSKPV